MAAYLEPGDLIPFAEIDTAKAFEMIADATALAMLVAPCLGDAVPLPAAKKAAVKAVLRAAVLRWNEAGTGAVQSQTAGPFSQSLDTRQQRRNLFWPSEIEQLQGICASAPSGAFSVDTVGSGATIHAEVCSVRFGALYCSCGAGMAGFPLYELP